MALRILRIFHETGRERSRYLKDAVDSVGQSRCHPANCFCREELLSVELTAVCQHSVKLRQRVCAGDSTERNNWLGSDGRIVHCADCVQSVRRREGFVDQRSWFNQIAIETLGLGRFTCFRRIDRRYAPVFFFRQADPKVELKRLSKNFAPVLAQSPSSDSPHELIKKKAKSACVITVGGSRGPEWLLFFKRINYGRIIENFSLLIQRAQPSLVRKQLCQRDRFLPALCELWPELRHPTFDFDLVFLQDMENTSGAQSLRRRPDQNQRVGSPELLTTSIAKSAVQIR